MSDERLTRKGLSEQKTRQMLWAQDKLSTTTSHPVYCLQMFICLAFQLAVFLTTSLLLCAVMFLLLLFDVTSLTYIQHSVQLMYYTTHVPYIAHCHAPQLYILENFVVEQGTIFEIF